MAVPAAVVEVVFSEILAPSMTASFVIGFLPLLLQIRSDHSVKGIL